MVAELSGDEGLRLIDEISGWEGVSQVERPVRRTDGVLAEALTVLFFVNVLSLTCMNVARLVKYIQDNFHRPVVVDLRGPEPEVKVLPAKPALLGVTIIQTSEGRSELAPSMSAPDIAAELKELM